MADENDYCKSILSHVTLPRIWKAINGLDYSYISNQDIEWSDDLESLEKISIYCRINALTMIQIAGSGHIGSSLSVIDSMIAAKSFDRLKSGRRMEEGSVFFTSKGHDAPGLYSVFHALRMIEDADLFTLRRLFGLPGHPEIGTPGVPTNTGSLGMGISKAKGFIYGARANRIADPNVFVFLGDGELQEGQIWESMATASRDTLNSLYVIVDGNRIQSDTWITRTSDLGNLEERVKSFGWSFFECNGHSVSEIINTLANAEKAPMPKFIYAKTVKGSGVKEFETFSESGEFYKFHSGAIEYSQYSSAVQELLALSESPLNKKSQENVLQIHVERPQDKIPKKRTNNLIEQWALLLLETCQVNRQIVVGDADLSYDTGTYLLRKHFPEKYLQFGIAEQDMVSTAGTLALSGCLPIVHSFASFLTNRAFEQIFNNSTENTQILYVGFLAGILPSAPGHSHQSVLDLALMKSIPNMQVFEPACAFELKICLNQALKHLGPSYFRLGSFEIAEDLNSFDDSSIFQMRKIGDQALILTSGPSSTNWALTAASLLEGKLSVSVSSRPFLTSRLTNKDLNYLSSFSHIFVVENHLPYLGTFNELEMMTAKNGTNGSKIFRIGLDEVPANGQADEVLRHHKLHPEQIADLILQECMRN